MSGRRYGKKTPASRTHAHASTPTSMKTTSRKNCVKVRHARNASAAAAENTIAGTGVWVRFETFPNVSGKIRSSDHAMIARFPYAIWVGTHSQIHAMKPTAIRTVSVTEPDPMPVSAGVYDPPGIPG